MNEYQFVLVVSLLIISIFEFIDGFMILKKRIRYGDIAMIEKSRRKFAILRSDLFEMARQNLIDINSVSVQFLYLHLTGLVRRPDQFRQFIEVYISTLSDKSEGDDSLLRKITSEISRWPKEAQDILRKTVEVMDRDFIMLYAPLRFKIWVYLFRLISSTGFGKKMLENMIENQRRDTTIQQYSEINRGILASA